MVRPVYMIPALPVDSLIRIFRSNTYTTNGISRRLIYCTLFFTIRIDFLYTRFPFHDDDFRITG